MCNAVTMRVVGFLFAVCVLFPATTFAFPFGGMVGQIIFCFNDAIFAAVGPPVGGPYIWTPSTRTYQFGPPTHPGQWVLGLAAPPYYCLVSIQPVIVWAGILMTMEGSSGGAIASGGGNGGGGGGGTTGGGGGVGSGIDHLVVSEVYYLPDTAHGGKPEYQWIEIFNPTSVAVDVSRWTLQMASSSQLVRASTTIAAKGYAIFAATTSVRTLWNLPTTTPLITFASPFTGLLPNGDHIYLVNTSSTTVDTVSYGRDTKAFSPPVPSVIAGHSIIRKNLVLDTDTAADWVDTATPNPGR